MQNHCKQRAILITHQGTFQKLVRVTDSTGYEKLCKINCFVVSWSDGIWKHPVTRDRIYPARGARRVRDDRSQAAIMLILYEKPNHATDKQVDNDTKTDSPETTDEVTGAEQAETTLPEVYADYADVSSTDLAAKLPSLEGRTHAIEIIEARRFIDKSIPYDSFEFLETIQSSHEKTATPGSKDFSGFYVRPADSIFPQFYFNFSRFAA
ncbi:hypothetical protein E4U57_001217 [Claviceps arundinis]|uniref:Uncharacterized protein n=1 Tax=Claviceps arundinis TaxID=1623583 RepID=A0ABQ7PB73_9HYPO|nr:hypothetical protein E4U57_001217 [Claviceps arundinis]